MPTRKRVISYLFAILGICNGVTTTGDLLQELVYLGVDIDTGTSTIGGLGSSISDGCHFVCDALALSFGTDRIVECDDQSAYDTGVSEYWSAQQSEVTPACLFRPAQAKEIAVALLLSRLAECQFAVKSGGHAAFKGASNIENGLTIDLGELNHIALSPSGNTASIGTGNTWYDVYTALEPLNRTVVGGRVASVGIGGLVLGGGISYLSNIYGWACDNIAEYEVVTASGAILYASEASHPDLYWALRGGGNNFGIVTRFTAYAYPQGQMWGGDRVFPIAVNTSLIQNFVAFGRGSNGTFEDPNAAIIMSFAFDTSSGTWLAVTSLEYAIPQQNGSRPAVFDGFFHVPDILSDGTANKFMSELTHDLDVLSPRGYRDTYWEVTFLLDERIISAVLEIWQEEAEKLTTTLGSGVQLPALDFQVITEPQLEHMRRAGGNALGLADEGSGPLVIAHWTYMWDDASKDPAILEGYQRIVDRAKAAGEALGANHQFIYMNYASQFQDPVSGYGPENKARLLAVSKKYDPHGVFQALQPGYFKLDRAPAQISP
ncbi:Bifunctional solanapyrone synthase [Cytospora mali]|uniref:Bifunctional solanapyrone synthase n=1 Tax=Cytospora mali TaxID=578113 RepID=A0A194V3D5_CYTMA|nr:Bifunctional solanapyrone synthase [Valsa mali var. pyri (nom. inval.)]